MFWRFKRLEEQVKQRAAMQQCRRCGLLHSKSFPQCPHCSNLGDAALRAALAKRARFRKRLATWMVAAGILILLLLFAF